MKVLQILAVLLTTAILLTACNNYGKKTTSGPIEVYYKDGISEEQAKATASYIANIDRTQNNNITERKSFQLCKQKDTVCLRMVSNKENAARINENAFMAIGNMVSENVFKGAPVNVDLTDKSFETFKSFHYKKLDFSKMGNPGE